MEITITAFLKCGNEQKKEVSDKLPVLDETSRLCQAHRHCLVANRKDSGCVFPVGLDLHLSGCHCQASVPVFSPKRRV